MKKITNKKAQLTLFIIIGLLLVLAGVGFFVLKESITEKDFETERKIVQTAPENIKPVKLYVEACLNDILKKGAQKLGTQGGYINTSEHMLKIIPLNPTESDGVDFFNNQELLIPYWYYLKSPNANKDYLMSSKRPSLHLNGEFNSITSQLNRYIEKEIFKCINNLDDFPEYESIEISSEPVANVIIRESDILAELFLDIRAKKGDLEFDISFFETNIDLDLKSIYDIATHIVNLQANHSISEMYVMNLISAFSDDDSSKLPPVDDSSFNPGKHVMWSKTKVKQNIEEMLMSYVPLLQVYGTINFRFNEFDSELAEALYTMSILPTHGTTETGFIPYMIDFTYLDLWPTYFNIEGRGVRGDIITSERAQSSFYSWIAINRYQNYYDVSFPIVVELTDPFAFNGEGYTFMFAIESNIRDNYPLGVSSDEPLTIDYTEFVTAQSLLCNPEQRNSGEVTIKAVNAETGMPAPDIPIYYSCGETCFLGILSKKDALLKTNLPLCYGGKITIMSPDYYAKPVTYSAKQKKSDTIEIPVYPIKTLDAEVFKKSVLKKGEKWEFSDQPLPLDKSAQSIVLISKIKEDPLDSEIISSFIYNGSVQKNAIQLVPGSYEIMITNLLYEDVIVPKDEICESAFFILGEECATLDEMKFDSPFPFGGLNLDNTYFEEFKKTSYYWNITPNQLYSADKAKFYTIAVPDGFMQTGSELKHEDLMELGKVAEYSARYRQKLEPELI